MPALEYPRLGLVSAPSHFGGEDTASETPALSRLGVVPISMGLVAAHEAAEESVPGVRQEGQVFAGGPPAALLKLLGTPLVCFM